MTFTFSIDTTEVVDDEFDQVSSKHKKVFIPTEEQANVRKLAVANNLLKVQSVSGSGKTSTLVYVSEADEMLLPSLYMTFNVSMAKEAGEKFGNHVECMTTHSLAYRKIGKGYQHKLSRPQGRYVNVALTGSEVAKFFKLPDFEIVGDQEISKNFIGLIIKETVERYEMSEQDHLSIDNIPYTHIATLTKKFGDNFPVGKFKKFVLKYANKLWEERTDKYSDVCCKHNTYLKLYQLSKPDLSSEYDIIYIDEAQDLNPVTRSIILMQKDKCKIIVVGDKFQQIYCQPKGTMVTVVEYQDRLKYNYIKKCISEVKVGDRVLSYQIEKSCMHVGGKPVTKVGSKNYNEKLIVINSEGKTSKYTKDHLVTVRVGMDNIEKYIVYLMKKGKQYRIGIVPWKYASSDGSFGLSQRCATEQADAAWILSVTNTRREATMYEAMVSYKKNIPQVCFKDRSRHENELSGEEFWEAFGNNEEDAKKVLSEHNLLIDMPLWSNRKSPIGRKKSMWSNLRMRSIFVTAACNVVSGMLVAHEDLITGKNIPLSAWKKCKVTTEDYKGTVYSLEVETDKTYFSDGILTHNCWNGSVNALQNIDAPEANLSKSFRFGNDVAELANMILGDAANVTGNDDIKSVVGNDVVDYTKPHTFLFRTNMELIFTAVNLIKNGNKVCVNIDMKDFVSMLKSADALFKGDMKAIKHENIIPFTTWGDLVEESKNDRELGRIVSIIDDGEADKMINVLHSHRNENDALITLTTAHKAKGLEYNQVCLANDFPSNYNNKGEFIGLSEEERNLLYVAATRAIDRLNINNTCQEFYNIYSKNINYNNNVVGKKKKNKKAKQSS